MIYDTFLIVFVLVSSHDIKITPDKMVTRIIILLHFSTSLSHEHKRLIHFSLSIMIKKKKPKPIQKASQQSKAKQFQNSGVSAGNSARSPTERGKKPLYCTDCSHDPNPHEKIKIKINIFTLDDSIRRKGGGVVLLFVVIFQASERERGWN